jgi:hypothetical protein
LAVNCEAWREDAEMLTGMKRRDERASRYPGPEDLGGVLGKLLGVCGPEELLCAGALRERMRAAV